MLTKAGWKIIGRKTLSEITIELGTKFIRCHRSFLVNKIYILTFVTKNENAFVELACGEKIPVGRSYYGNIKKNFTNAFYMDT